RAARVLAFPHLSAPDTASSPSEEEAQRLGMRAEEAQLQATLTALRALTLPQAEAVFVPTNTRMWRALPTETDTADDTAAITPEALPWPDFASGAPVIMTSVDQPDLWARLTAYWRQPAISPQVLARITLVPILVADELCAVCALGHAAPVNMASTADAWLPSAAAIAITGGAGIQALRLELRAQAEARARDAFISLAAHALRSPLTA